MKFRGIYSIQQTDRTLPEETLRAIAQNAIAQHLVEQVAAQYGGDIIKESQTQSDPYGRYYLDLEVTLAQDTVTTLNTQTANSNITTITG